MSTSARSCPLGEASSCPFLRNIPSATGFSLNGGGVNGPLEHGPNNPIFAEGIDFEHAFDAFHGDHGVLPLPRSAHGSASNSSWNSFSRTTSACPFLKSTPQTSSSEVDGRKLDEAGQEKPEGLAAALATAPLATIGLSAFGGGGFFGFDALKGALEARKRREKEAEQEQKQKQQQEEQQQKRQQEKSDAPEADGNRHEAIGEDWLATGNCPIARSYRAFNRFVPAMAAAFKPPQGVKYVCPPAIVAMRAEVAKHPWMKTLRPQALPIRVLAIGTMGMFLNIPLGAWREHLVKFSPQWILVVHASVPFVAVLRKAALMPKYAMAFTVAASIIGQTIGAKLERKRMAKISSPSGADQVQSDRMCVKRKPSRRRLGHGILGLGGMGSKDMVAFDCCMDSGPNTTCSKEASPSQGHAQFSRLEPGGEMVTAAA